MRRICHHVPAPHYENDDRWTQHAGKLRQSLPFCDRRIAQRDDCEPGGDQSQQHRIGLLEIDQQRGDETETPRQVFGIAGAAVCEARQHLDPDEAEGADRNHGSAICVRRQHHVPVEARIEEDGDGNRRGDQKQRRAGSLQTPPPCKRSSATLTTGPAASRKRPATNEAAAIVSGIACGYAGKCENDGARPNLTSEPWLKA